MAWAFEAQDGEGALMHGINYRVSGEVGLAQLKRNGFSKLFNEEDKKELAK